jgi:CubicO group peptidase (beta-lactamase class C family)
VRTLLAVLALGVGAVLPASGPEGSIDAFIDREMPASGVPGLAYAVVDGGGITAAGARGVVRLGGGVAVTPDTPFVIGSISKSFTALSVMQLIEAGEIDLDSEVSRYLDVFSGRPAGVITIGQLLSHTSGFSTEQGNAAQPDPTGAGDELARGVAQLAAVTPAGAPGTQWEYSNANYEILGRVVEVVSGQEFQAYVAQHILEPVGMGHSFVADGEVHEGMATGHLPWFGTKRPLPDTTTDRATAPQGGIVASASDLARYLQMMMNGQDDVLSAQGKALMMRPASEVSPSYGLGWKLDPGTGAVWHDGSSPGVETLAMMVPAQKKAAVVLVNGGSGFGFAETGHLRVGIADRALGLDDDADGSGWSRKALFIGLVALPIVYLLSMVWAWLRRSAVRAKSTSGIFGLFSLWFPLLTTLVAAWVLLGLVSNLFGTPLSTLRLFAPDLVLTLIATAVTGVLWAVFRLAVAYTGRSGPTLRASPATDDRT